MNSITMLMLIIRLFTNLKNLQVLKNNTNLIIKNLNNKVLFFLFIKVEN